MSNIIDTIDKLTDRIDWAHSMALQVGSEKFATWNEEIRSEYGDAMANYLEEAQALVREIDDQRQPKS